MKLRSPGPGSPWDAVLIDNDAGDAVETRGAREAERD
jgi:hypothetical protein